MMSWKKMSLKVQLSICVTFLLISIVLVGGTGLYALKSVKNILDEVFDVRLPSVDYILQADRDLQQMLVAERSLLFSELSKKQEESLFLDYSDNRRQAEERFQKYSQLNPSEDEKKIIDSYNIKRKAWIKQTDKVLELIKSGQKDRAIKLSFGTSSEAFEDMREQMNKAQELILSYAENENAHAAKVFENSQILQIAIFLVGSGFGLFLSILTTTTLVKLLRQTNHRLEDSAEKLGVASSTIATTSTTLSSSSTKQSSSLTETVSSLQEISSMVEKNTESAEYTLKLARESKSNADEGTVNVREMVAAMNEIKESNELMVNKVKESNEEIKSVITIIQEIGNKTEVINDIVFQTKLLSFNASVEAARAGEMGKGFAVVAQEVGNLAELSGNSSQEITQLLEKSVTAVEGIVQNSTSGVENLIRESAIKIDKGIKVSKSCESNLEEICRKVSMVSQSAGDITQASREQTAGVSEISMAMNEFESTNHSTNSLISETSELADNIKVQAGELKAVIKELSKLVGKKSS